MPSAPAWLELWNAISGSVKALRLPVGIALLPVAGVRSEAVGELMVAPVLRGLIGVIVAVAGAEAGRVDKSQAQRVVIRFVGARLAVGEHGNAVSPALVGQVEPLV